MNHIKRNVRYVFICTKTMRMTSLLDEELKNTEAMQVLLTQIQTESVCQTHAIHTKHIITYISVIIKSFRNRTLEVIKIYLFSPWSFQRVICYGYFVFIFHFISSLLSSSLLFSPLLCTSMRDLYGNTICTSYNHDSI